MLTPLPDFMRRIERYRPKGKPYRADRDLAPFDPTTMAGYAQTVLTALLKRTEMADNERYYLHFFANAVERSSPTMADSLRKAAANLRVTGLDPLNLDDHPSITIQGLENVKKANWRFLPSPRSLSPEQLLDLLQAHIDQHGTSAVVFEIKRVEFALSLEPKEIAVGIDEFAGYYAFVFPKDVVLFECPAYGNAAYVVRGDWQTLSQHYKAELESKGIRVIHRGRGWRRTIRAALVSAAGAKSLNVLDKVTHPNL